MAVLPSYFAIINNVNLNTVNGLQIYNINTFTLPHRQLNMFTLARTHGQKLSSAFFDKRQMSISLWINVKDRQTLDQSLDKLFSIIQDTETSLVVPQSNGVRQYTVTFDSIVNNNTTIGSSSVYAPKGGLTDITLIFNCSDSFGYDTNYTSITNQTGLTSGNVNVPYTQGGSVDTQVPYIQIKYTGAASNTGTVSIGNQNTGQVIQVTATFNQFDILAVDVRNRTVQINGVDVAFSGAFPEFGLGLQTLYYLDTFSTRTFNFFAYVYNRWL